MEKRYERLGRRYAVWVAFAAVLLFGLVVAVFALRRSAPDFSRISVVIVSDPVTIWSYAPATGKFIRLTIPGSAVVDATGGYGRYALEALWKLGAMDNRGGSVLTQSLEEAVGIPISWYLKPSNDRSGSAPITLAMIPSVLLGRTRTNMPFTTLVSLAWAGTWLRPEDTTVLTVDEDHGLVSQTLPDGRSEQVMDTTQLDSLIGSNFEDERIRKEGMSVAVYNTTGTPTIANRVTRMLTHMGILVIRVGNESPPVDRCILRGKKQGLETATSRVIISVFGCTTLEEAVDRADLELRVGTGYANRFFPKKVH